LITVFSLIDTHSNGAGHIISRPKPTRRIAAAECSVAGSKSKIFAIAFRSSATAENESTKPAAMAAGRILLLCPTEAPSRIGSTGRVQGAAMVTTPASSARTRESIEGPHGGWSSIASR
jgi:hypothetical protein